MQRSDLNHGDLGPGWEQTESALAALQADLSRTVSDAPTLALWWCAAGARDEWPFTQDPSGRWAFIGRDDGWFYGADGGFELSRNYAEALGEMADELFRAIADTLLGYYAYWPHCPVDDHPLAVRADSERQCKWVCTHDGQTIAEVGRLPGHGPSN